MNKKLTAEAVQIRLRLWLDSYGYDCGILPIDKQAYAQLKEKLQQKPTMTREKLHDLFLKFYHDEIWFPEVDKFFKELGVADLET